MTLQLGPVKGVGSESSALEPVSDVGQICDPSQVYRNRVEGYEETAEQQEWHGHYRGQEYSVLWE